MAEDPRISGLSRSWLATTPQSLVGLGEGLRKEALAGCPRCQAHPGPLQQTLSDTQLTHVRSLRLVGDVGATLSPEPPSLD